MRKKQDTILHPWETPDQYVRGEEMPVDRESASLPAVENLSDARDIGVTTLRFVFMTHTEQNQEKAKAFIEGCDILAVESVPGEVYDNVSERQKANRYLRDRFDAISMLASGKTDPKTAKRLKESGFSVDLYPSWNEEERRTAIRTILPGRNAELLASTVGKVEKIVKVDLDHKDSKYEDILIQEEKQAEASLVEAIALSGAGWQELEHLELNRLKSRNRHLSLREKKTARQLEKLVRDNPGKTIGVLEGASHQILPRLIKTGPNVSLQRMFVPQDENEAAAYLAGDFYAECLYNATNTERGGYVNDKQMRQLIVADIVRVLGMKQALLTLSALSGASREAFESQAQQLWSEPILSSDPNASACVRERQEATLRLLKATK